MKSLTSCLLIGTALLSLTSIRNDARGCQAPYGGGGGGTGGDVAIPEPSAEEMARAREMAKAKSAALAAQRRARAKKLAEAQKKKAPAVPATDQSEARAATLVKMGSSLEKSNRE